MTCRCAFPCRLGLLKGVVLFLPVTLFHTFATLIINCIVVWSVFDYGFLLIRLYVRAWPPLLSTACRAWSGDSGDCKSRWHFTPSRPPPVHA
ncbi:hypothetical protein EON66_10605 [archaeon]|nr:MAG: hypothetical protein EON66_10605 [archaeon]